MKTLRQCLLIAGAVFNALVFSNITLLAFPVNLQHQSANSPDITFSSTPGVVGSVNVLYYYDANASSPLGSVKYHLLAAPRQAAIDSVTGVVTFTTALSGYADFKVRAMLTTDPHNFTDQSWRVYFDQDSVRDLKHCIYVYGRVLDDYGQATITKGKIYCSPGPPRERPGSIWVANIGSDGRFEMPLPYDGKYFFQANPGGYNIDFDAEYYPNTYIARNATEFDLQCGDRLELNFNVTFRPIPNKMSFKSSPPLTGDPNYTYTYDAFAKTTNNDPIKYTLIEPATATIDENTGMVRYDLQGSAPATIDFHIKAEVVGDPSLYVEQSWEVLFATDSAANCVRFRGPVVDTNGFAITEGVVTAKYLGSSTRQPQTFQWDINDKGWFDGYAPFKGDYVLSVSGPHFTTTWYDGAASEQQAKILTMKCGDEKQCDFTVTPNGAYYTISGTVLSDSGYAVGAYIYAEDVASNAKYVGINNLSGAYTMYVPKNISVVLHATPKWDDWFEEYYDNVMDPTLATTVLVDANKTGIDFALDRRPTYQNLLSGTTVGVNNQGLRTVLRLYKVVTSGGVSKLWARDDVASASSGAFSFNNIPPGDYVVKAKFVVQDYVPGWYKQNSIAAIAWQDATQITMTATSSVTGLNFQLRERNGVRGTNEFLGQVTEDASGFTEGEFPVKGVLVHLLDMDGHISNYAETDEEGKFDMGEIASGSYTLITDHPDYSGYREEIELQFNGSDPITRDIKLNTQTPTSVHSVPVASAFRAEIYPNPVNSEAYVNVTGDVRKLSIRLYNQLGAEIERFASTIEGASGTIRINSGALPQGNYYLVLTGAGTMQTVRFSKLD